MPKGSQGATSPLILVGNKRGTKLGTLAEATEISPQIYAITEYMIKRVRGF